ncbi:hypothetical protein BLNAU_16911 [Blattamonas nauphoetae]|uniref:Uncharacterized protein n=1 Tax=Blattamonas nauphoetae TaxID=2049346 RepID=A0ABQ9X816_9EUKA|nr:hypothetical protein BLNAU_16911 [Blattamonas nauphoetae]
MNSTQLKQYLNLPLKDTSRKIIDLKADLSRSLIYHLSETGSLGIYSFSRSDASIDFITELQHSSIESSIKSFIRTQDRNLLKLPSSSFMLINIQPLPLHSTSTRCLVGITQSGIRLYFQMKRNSLGGFTSLSLTNCIISPPFSQFLSTGISQSPTSLNTVSHPISSIRCGFASRDISFMSESIGPNEDRLYIIQNSLSSNSDPLPSETVVSMNCGQVYSIQQLPSSRQIESDGVSADFFAASQWDRPSSVTLSPLSPEQRAIASNPTAQFSSSNEILLPPPTFHAFTSRGILKIIVNRPTDILKSTLEQTPSSDAILTGPTSELINNLAGQIGPIQFCTSCLSLATTPQFVSDLQTTQTDLFYAPQTSLENLPQHPNSSPLAFDGFSSPLTPPRLLKSPIASPLHSIVNPSSFALSPTSLITSPMRSSMIIHTPKDPIRSSPAQTVTVAITNHSTKSNNQYVTPPNPFASPTKVRTPDLHNPFVSSSALQLFRFHSTSPSPLVPYMFAEMPKSSLTHVSALLQTLSRQPLSTKHNSLLLLSARLLKPLWNTPLISFQTSGSTKKESTVVPWYHPKRLTSIFNSRKHINVDDDDTRTIQVESVLPIQKTKRTESTRGDSDGDTLSEEKWSETLDRIKLNPTDLDYPDQVLHSFIQSSHSSAASPRGRSCSSSLILHPTILLQFANVLSSLITLISTPGLSLNGQSTHSVDISSAFLFHSPQAVPGHLRFSSLTTTDKVSALPSLISEFESVFDSEKTFEENMQDDKLVEGLLLILMRSYQIVLALILLADSGVPLLERKRARGFLFRWDGFNDIPHPNESFQEFTLRSLVFNPFCDQFLIQLIKSVLLKDSYTSQFSNTFSSSSSPLSAFQRFCPAFISRGTSNLTAVRNMISIAARNVKGQTRPLDEFTESANVSEIVQLLEDSIDEVDLDKYCPLLCAIRFPSSVVELVQAKCRCVDPDRLALVWVENGMMVDKLQGYYEQRAGLCQFIIQTIEWECKFRSQHRTFGISGDKEENSQPFKGILETTTLQKVLICNDILIKLPVFEWMASNPALHEALFSIRSPDLLTFFRSFCSPQTPAAHQCSIDLPWKCAKAQDDKPTLLSNLMSLAHDSDLSLSLSCFGKEHHNVIGLRLHYLAEAQSIVVHSEQRILNFGKSAIQKKIKDAQKQLRLVNKLEKLLSTPSYSTNSTAAAPINDCLEALDREILDSKSLNSLFSRFSLIDDVDGEE